MIDELDKKTAKLKGEKTYNTGLPCKYGHYCDRYVRGGRCLECMSGGHHRSTKWYKNRDLERRKMHIVQRAKYRAKAKGIEFSINTNDVPWQTHCPILGVELEYFSEKGRKRRNSVSLDRIDPTKGYVPGNIGVVSDRANSIKNNATKEILQKILTYMEQNGEAKSICGQ